MNSAKTLSLVALAGLLTIALGVTVHGPLQSADSGTVVGAASKGREEFVPGEILVKRVDRVTDSALKKSKQRVGGKKIKGFPILGIEVWKLDSGMPAGKAVAELRKAEHGHAVEFAEPNWIYYADQMPNDPRMPELWGLFNVEQTGGTKDADIDASEAWAVTTGSTQIVIGVIDSGVDYLHEDLAANIWVNPDETLNGEDTDGNGYIDDIHGWDFVNNDNDPMDDFWHGTHTAGTIGAVGNNGIGISGVNWDVTIMPLKFLNSGGWGTTDDAIEAVLYAASFDGKVPITNNSWGGGRKSRALEDAIRDSGSLFIASAGNSGRSRKQYPAGYALDNVLSVAATDHDDNLASFSNYGVSWVDLAAPGVEILSTVPNDDYDWSDGTSMAAPHVAGVAGLVMAVGLGTDPLSTKEQILNTVDPLDSLAGLVLTGGRLNAARTVGIEPSGGGGTAPAAVEDLTVDLSTTEYTMVGLTWTAPADDGSSGAAAIYDVRYDFDPIKTDAEFETAAQAEGEPVPQTAGSEERLVVTGLAKFTDYYFALKSTDDLGNASVLSNSPPATTGDSPPGESICDDGLDDDGDGDIDCDDFDCALDSDSECSCGNNVCEPGETTDVDGCLGCPEDCLAVVTADWSCGDGVCQPEIGEDCTTCPNDCAGRLAGKPAKRFCCGGSGQYGVGCTDSRCSTWPNACDGDSPEEVSACCGNNSAEELEFEWTCGIDVCKGGPGVNPTLFLISYDLDWNGQTGITTLAAGATFNLYGTPNASPLKSDIPECRVDCAGNLRAYYHDVVSGREVGDRFWGLKVDTSMPCVGDDCCSHATDAGYNLECCLIP